MAVTAGICNSFKAEILQGIHLPTDTYKIALYDPATASLDPTTAVYTTTGEVAGAGYTAGGQALTGFAVTLVNGVAVLDFNDASWANATITAGAALIYNATQGNKAVAVLDFGGNVSSTNATFTVQMPAPDDVNGLIRIA